MAYDYSLQLAKDKKVAKAQAYDLNCSYKDLSQVCNNLKGKSVVVARKMLQDVISMKMPILFTRFNTGLGHRSQLGGKKGKFPKKEAGMMLKLLGNAVNNAKQLGLDEKKLFVMHALANKQNVMVRYKKYFANSMTLGYGKQSRFANYVTARVELYLHEQELKEKVKSKGKKAVGAVKEAKKTEAKTPATEKKPVLAKQVKEEKIEKVEAAKEAVAASV